MNNLDRKLRVFAADFPPGHIHYDNGPSESWLKSKQDTAEKYMKLHKKHGGTTAKGLFGPTTAFARHVNLPVSYLRKFPGANDEKPKLGSIKYDELKHSVDNHGWIPEEAGKIMLAVNHRGKPYIYEGNNRLQMAHELGHTHIPTEVTWFNGGNKVEGPAHP